MVTSSIKYIIKLFDYSVILLLPVFSCTRLSNLVAFKTFYIKSLLIYIFIF